MSQIGVIADKAVDAIKSGISYEVIAPNQQAAIHLLELATFKIVTDEAGLPRPEWSTQTEQGKVRVRFEPHQD